MTQEPPRPPTQPFAGSSYPPAPGLGGHTRIPQRANGTAIAALVTAFFFAPLGIILGASVVKETVSGDTGRGMAITAIVLGTLNTIFAMIMIGVFVFFGLAMDGWANAGS